MAKCLGTIEYFNEEGEKKEFTFELGQSESDINKNDSFYSFFDKLSIDELKTIESGIRSIVPTIVKNKQFKTIDIKRIDENTIGNLNLTNLNDFIIDSSEYDIYSKIIDSLPVDISKRHSIIKLNSGLSNKTGIVTKKDKTFYIINDNTNNMNVLVHSYLSYLNNEGIKFKELNNIIGSLEKYKNNNKLLDKIIKFKTDKTRIREFLNSFLFDSDFHNFVKTKPEYDRINNELDEIINFNIFNKTKIKFSENKATDFFLSLNKNGTFYDMSTTALKKKYGHTGDKDAPIDKNLLYKFVNSINNEGIIVNGNRSYLSVEHIGDDRVMFSVSGLANSFLSSQSTAKLINPIGKNHGNLPTLIEKIGEFNIYKTNDNTYFISKHYVNNDDSTSFKKYKNINDAKREIDYRISSEPSYYETVGYENLFDNSLTDKPKLLIAKFNDGLLKNLKVGDEVELLPYNNRHNTQQMTTEEIKDYIRKVLNQQLNRLSENMKDKYANDLGLDIDLKTYLDENLNLINDRGYLSLVLNNVANTNSEFDFGKIVNTIKTLTVEGYQPTGLYRVVNVSENGIYNLKLTDTEMSSTPKYRGNTIKSNMAEIVNNMSIRTGIKVELINTYKMKDILNIEQNELYSKRAFVLNGNIYVNMDLANEGDLIHEYSHLILGSLKGTHPEFYNNFLEKLMTDETFRSRVQDRSKRDKTRIMSDVIEEEFVTLYGEFFKKTNIGDGDISLFKNYFNNELSDLFRIEKDLSGIDINPKTTTLNDLFTSFGTLLTSDFAYNNFNSDLSIQSRKLNNVLSLLKESGILKEKC